ncbi:MAG: hypothetical protein IKF14_13330 [Atopobiaceae bacterium]|nr:hypothetical protein [Atopobiaceae bacterium]
MQSYEIDVNPLSMDAYRDLLDCERFVRLDTNTGITDIYSVIDTFDDEEEVIDKLGSNLRRRFGRGAVLHGYEDASYWFDDDEE